MTVDTAVCADIRTDLRLAQLLEATRGMTEAAVRMCHVGDDRALDQDLRLLCEMARRLEQRTGLWTVEGHR